MKKVDLKREIRAAISEEWPEFAAKHPRLAAVLDEQMLMESVVESLPEDAEFRATMDRAEAMGMGASVATDAVQRFVREWMEKLF